MAENPLPENPSSRFAQIRNAAAALLVATQRLLDGQEQALGEVQAAMRHVRQATTCPKCEARRLFNGVHCDGVCQLPSSAL